MAMLIAVSTASAQKRNNNWVMSNNVWFSFSTGTIQLLPLLSYQPGMRAGCISDTAGNFLFLADSLGVHDALYNLMPNGSASALGWPIDLGNCMILPKPGSPERYMVFLNGREDFQQAGYVEVDMSLNGGLGDVVSSTTTWYMDSATTKLSATPQANGAGYWVMLHEDGTDEFHAYSLTNTGLGPTPVITHAGSDFLPTGSATGFSMDFWGPLKFSPKSDLLAIVTYGPPPDTTAHCEIYRFNDTTGTADFIVSLDGEYKYSTDPGTQHYNGCHNWTGLEFDAQGEHAYVQTWDTVGTWNCAGPHTCVEISVRNLDPDTMAARRFIACIEGATGGHLHDFRGGALVVGTDGLLYSRSPQLAPRQIRRGLYLPVEDSTIGLGYYMPYILYPAGTHLHGFPNLCRRYLDDPGVPTSLQPVAPTIANLGIRPNPMNEIAVLDMNSLPWPTRIIWRDALGRIVREEAARMDGPSVVLQRSRLQSGLYQVEAWSKGGLIGTARVVCD